MSAHLVQVRYPGVPLDLEAPGAQLPPGVDIASTTVCGPEHTTLHLQVEAANAHEALELGMRGGDRIARSLGLDIRHAAAVTSA